MTSGSRLRSHAQRIGLVTLAPGRFVLVAALSLTICLSTSHPASARDSLAPPSAGHRWLPTEDWVTHHWLPYDERRLLSILRISRAQLRDWLRDDRHHRLDQLVRLRGLHVAAVTERLVAPLASRVDPVQYGRLRERAERTLTQGHLAQHAFFHYLHQSEVMAHAWEVFGVSPARYHRLRAAGFTPAEIGALRGRRRASVGRAIKRVCRLSAAAGVRRRETPARQAARFLSRQRRSVGAYLDQVLHAPRRARLGLPATARRAQTRGRALRKLRVATRRIAHVLPNARRSRLFAPPTSQRTVVSSLAVWPAEPFGPPS